jgi:hypothetical protein
LLFEPPLSREFACGHFCPGVGAKELGRGAPGLRRVDPREYLPLFRLLANIDLETGDATGNQRASFGMPRTASAHLADVRLAVADKAR